MDPIGAVLAAESARPLLLADPLANRRFCCVTQRRAAEAVAQGLEVFLRSGNSAGKTELGATLAVALAQGRERLDARTILEALQGLPVVWLELPRLAAPNVGWLVVQSYRQGVDSATRALRHALGSWPHREVYVSGQAQGYLGSLYVRPMHATSEDYRAWSRITVIPDQGELPRGARIDWAWADEIPSAAVWGEVRMRLTAGRPFPRWITATPDDRRRWAWIRDDFRGCLDAPSQGRLELEMPVSDNQALSAADLEELRRNAAGPLFEARWYGRYVDTVGLAAFDLATLQAWRERCRPPGRWAADRRVEVWDPPREGQHYLLPLDPSAGLRDAAGKHDPCGLWVVHREGAAGVVRFNGYLSAMELGTLGARLAQAYNEALVVPLVAGGFGEALLHGLGDYPHVYRDEHATSPSAAPLRRPGWRETASSRGLAMAALQRAIAQDSLRVPSLEAVESLMDTVCDEAGRVAKRPGVHDEDLDLLGIAAYLLEALPPVQRRPVDRPKAFEDALAEMFGSRASRPPRRPWAEDAW